MVATSFGTCDTGIRSFGSKQESKRSYFHVISFQAQYIEDLQQRGQTYNLPCFAKQIAGSSSSWAFQEPVLGARS